MKSVIIKLSGESLASNTSSVDEEHVLKYTESFNYFIERKYKIILIVGGGNLIRGRDFVDKNNIDKAGMLATMINGILVNSILTSHGYNTNLYSNVSSSLIQTYSGKITSDITIITGGSGKIGFSTDILMILTAMELNPHYVIKMTNVKGVLNRKGQIYQKLSLKTMMHEELFAIDRTAVALAMENNINFYISHVNAKIFEFTGTYVSNDCDDLLYNSHNVDSETTEAI